MVHKQGVFTKRSANAVSRVYSWGRAPKSSGTGVTFHISCSSVNKVKLGELWEKSKIKVTICKSNYKPQDHVWHLVSHPEKQTCITNINT